MRGTWQDCMFFLLTFHHLLKGHHIFLWAPPVKANKEVSLGTNARVQMLDETTVAEKEDKGEDLVHY